MLSGKTRCSSLGIAMLWTLVSVRDGQVTTSVHVDGPEPGDLVVVTAEAALRRHGSGD